MQGEERASRWESSPGFFRRFCRRCGSVVPGEPAQGRVFLPAGNFDDDPGLRPQLHIFVASKAPWYEIPDALPRFDAYPPGHRRARSLPDRPHAHAGSAVHGSCRAAPSPSNTRARRFCVATATAAAVARPAPPRTPRTSA